MSRGPDHGLDRLLDRTVLLGYSAAGLAIRRRGWPEDDPAPDALSGRRALVTGAAGGLGEAMALGLARLGARVHLVVRRADRAAAVVARFADERDRHAGSGSLEIGECDVSDLGSVRRFATDLSDRLVSAEEALDIVVHNAGVMPRERTESVDGFELTVATHVLGPILMTELLLPALRRSGDARVIHVSSGGMYTQPLPVTDPQFRQGRYRGAQAYARSKRMQVELGAVLAERWGSDLVSVYAMHPGWVDTPGIAASLPLFRRALRPILRTPEAGADTVLWLAATVPAPPSGTFWHDRRERPTDYRTATRATPAETAGLWAWVQEAIGLV